MYTLKIETKFKFDDYVQFDSELQNCSGKGLIYGITVDRDGNIDYMILVKESGHITPEIYENEDDDDLTIQPGILESEIQLLRSA